jgi:hypothetical protein
MYRYFNPLKAELYPICHLLALLRAYPIPDVSRIRVKHGICLESGMTLPDRSVVNLAATTPCRLRLCTVLGSLDIHSICNIPRTAISTSSLFCNVQNTIDTSVCLEIMLNSNGT